MTWRLLRAKEALAIVREPVEPGTLAGAASIVEDVRRGGDAQLRKHAERLGDITAEAPLVVTRRELARERDTLATSDRELLERAAARISGFAQAQRDALSAVNVPIPGGRAGHDIAAVARAGCYAPGGRYPLPSSVLMTAITARVAGVDEVWVASPRPSSFTMAAAAIADADALLAVGGAHAIAALAFGTESVPAVEVIVGPGNQWVTAAKHLVSGRVGIDFLAGPSELVVIADDGADASGVAADLIAQAEHAPDAMPVLITTSPSLASRVEAELVTQLADLPSANIARRALANGFAVLCSNLAEAMAVCDHLAPEHVELALANAEAVARKLKNFGAVFIGPTAGEVLGDYGAGPNHVLPTGGSARFTGGLSVMHFLRIRTWLRIDDPQAATELAADAARLARIEGLEGHARAADRRASGSKEK